MSSGGVSTGSDVLLFVFFLPKSAFVFHLNITRAVSDNNGWTPDAGGEVLLGYREDAEVLQQIDVIVFGSCGSCL